jgi:hypothetical protein
MKVAPKKEVFTINELNLHSEEDQDWDLNKPSIVKKLYQCPFPVI